MLVFFVLLVSMSEVKKDEQWKDFVQALQAAFGYVGGVRPVHYEDANVPRNFELAEMLIVPINWQDFSKARDPGIRGTLPASRDNRPEEVFVVGGRLQFPLLSAELPADEAARIPQLAQELRGLRTMLKVIGHCSQEPVTGTPFAHHRDLAYARACVVADQLIAQGISPKRILIEVAGTNQPVAQRTYTTWDKLQNDLVEVVQIDDCVDELDQ
jgi:chemotaxis protein MotB